MSKARELADVIGTQGTTEQVLSGRRNLIINGDFQVSQRGDYTTATTASHNTYYLDRWKIESGLSQTVQDTGYKQKLVITAGGTNISGFRQKIEDKTYNRLVNKTVTFSAKVTSNSANARLALYADGWHVSTPHTGGGSEETLTLTVTLPSSFTYGLIPEICICGAGYSNVAIATNDYIEAGEAQLELGSVATPFEHRSYGEELALCQRYYVRQTYEASIYQHVHFGMALNTAYCAINIEYPVTMRGAPTLQFSSASSFRVNDGLAHDETCNNIVQHNTTKEMMRIHFYKATANMNVGYCAYINRETSSSPCWLAFDAEL